MNWRVFCKEVTDSTNKDARTGVPGDVFTAGYQTAGRGRLDHKWLSRPNENLMMSAVLDVAGLSPEHSATIPLVVGLSVCDALGRILASVPARIALKWPNDVLADGRKIAGILCERVGDNVIAGIGVNVNQREFQSEIASRATSLALLFDGDCSAGTSLPSVDSVRDIILDRLGDNYKQWLDKGLAALLPRIAAMDCLSGREVSIKRTDDDAAPVSGICGGIAADGSLVVAGEHIYAGEAHVLRRAAFSGEPAEPG